MKTDNRPIQGFQAKSKEIKLTQYTDHLAIPPSDMDSINDAVSTL